MLKWLLAAVGLYGAFVTLLYVARRSLQYLPERQRMAPLAAGLPEADEVVLENEMPGWWRGDTCQEASMSTIALVDDDRNILTSVSLALEAEGYRIMTYTDGDATT